MDIDFDGDLRVFRDVHWSPRSSFEGTHIFGATGSGKTSGSGRALALALLRAGYGGLVLTYKPGEAATWRRYLEETGRAAHFLRVAPDTSERFNFLRYETSRETRGAGIAKNVAQRFLEAIDEQGARSQDPYWDLALSSLLVNAMDTVLLARVAPTVDNVHSVILSAPTATKHKAATYESSACVALLLQASKRADLSDADRVRLDRTVTYWSQEFATLPDKQRTSVVGCFTARATDLLRPPLSSLFGDHGEGVRDTFAPEQSHKGKVIVLDFPIVDFGETGRFAQRLYKTSWQHAALQRAQNANTLPLFLWVDEAHHFVTTADALFQSACRESRVASLYLAQNLANYYAFFAARDPKQATDGFLGSLLTQVFHQNDDTTTNEWAEKRLGGKWVDIERSSEQSSSPVPGAKNYFDTVPGTRGKSIGPEWRPDVPASTFKDLAPGGPPNHSAEAIVKVRGFPPFHQSFPTPRA